MDKDNYKKDGNKCENCHNIFRKKYINKEKKRVVNSVNMININKNRKEFVDSVNKNNRILIIGFSISGKTYLLNHIVHQKRELIFTITKSLTKYLDIKAQTSDEIKPLENYEKSTVVLDDMLLSKQESNIDLFFTPGRHNNIDNYYISRSFFRLPKNTIRIISNRPISFEQTTKDIILIFHDIAGLDMNLEDWKQLHRKSSENDYLQTERFAKIGQGRYTNRNCNKNTYTECTPESKPF